MIIQTNNIFLGGGGEATTTTKWQTPPAKRKRLGKQISFVAIAWFGLSPSSFGTPFLVQPQPRNESNSRRFLRQRTPFEQGARKNKVPDNEEHSTTFSLNVSDVRHRVIPSQERHIDSRRTEVQDSLQLLQALSENPPNQEKNFVPLAVPISPFNITIGPITKLEQHEFLKDAILAAGPKRFASDILVPPSLQALRDIAREDRSGVRSLELELAQDLPVLYNQALQKTVIIVDEGEAIFIVHQKCFTLFTNDCFDIPSEAAAAPNEGNARYLRSAIQKRKQTTNLRSRTRRRVQAKNDIPNLFDEQRSENVSPSDLADGSEVTEIVVIAVKDSAMPGFLSTLSTDLFDISSLQTTIDKPTEDLPEESRINENEEGVDDKQNQSEVSPLSDNGSFELANKIDDSLKIFDIDNTSTNNDVKIWVEEVEPSEDQLPNEKDDPPSNEEESQVSNNEENPVSNNEDAQFPNEEDASNENSTRTVEPDETVDINPDSDGSQEQTTEGSDSSENTTESIDGSEEILDQGASTIEQKEGDEFSNPSPESEDTNTLNAKGSEPSEIDEEIDEDTKTSGGDDKAIEITPDEILPQDQEQAAGNNTDEEEENNVSVSDEEENPSPANDSKEIDTTESIVGREGEVHINTIPTPTGPGFYDGDFPDERIGVDNPVGGGAVMSNNGPSGAQSNPLLKIVATSVGALAALAVLLLVFVSARKKQEDRQRRKDNENMMINSSNTNDGGDDGNGPEVSTLSSTGQKQKKHLAVNQDDGSGAFQNDLQGNDSESRGGTSSCGGVSSQSSQKKKSAGVASSTAKRFLRLGGRNGNDNNISPAFNEGNGRTMYKTRSAQGLLQPSSSSFSDSGKSSSCNSSDGGGSIDGIAKPFAFISGRKALRSFHNSFASSQESSSSSDLLVLQDEGSRVNIVLSNDDDSYENEEDEKDHVPVGSRGSINTQKSGNQDMSSSTISASPPSSTSSFMNWANAFIVNTGGDDDGDHDNNSADEPSDKTGIDDAAESESSSDDHTSKDKKDEVNSACERSAPTVQTNTLFSPTPFLSNNPEEEQARENIAEEFWNAPLKEKDDSSEEACAEKGHEEGEESSVESVTSASKTPSSNQEGDGKPSAPANLGSPANPGSPAKSEGSVFSSSTIRISDLIDLSSPDRDPNLEGTSKESPKTESQVESNVKSGKDKDELRGGNGPLKRELPTLFEETSQDMSNSPDSSPASSKSSLKSIKEDVQEVKREMSDTKLPTDHSVSDDSRLPSGDDEADFSSESESSCESPNQEEGSRSSFAAPPPPIDQVNFGAFTLDDISPATSPTIFRPTSRSSSSSSSSSPSSSSTSPFGNLDSKSDTTSHAAEKVSGTLRTSNDRNGEGNREKPFFDFSSLVWDEMEERKAKTAPSTSEIKEPSPSASPSPTQTPSQRSARSNAKEGETQRDALSPVSAKGSANLPKSLASPGPGWSQEPSTPSELKKKPESSNSFGSGGTSSGEYGSERSLITTSDDSANYSSAYSRSPVTHGTSGSSSAYDSAKNYSFGSSSSDEEEQKPAHLSDDEAKGGFPKRSPSKKSGSAKLLSTSFESVEEEGEEEEEEEVKQHNKSCASDKCSKRTFSGSLPPIDVFGEMLTYESFMAKHDKESVPPSCRSSDDSSADEQSSPRKKDASPDFKFKSQLLTRTAAPWKKTNSTRRLDYNEDEDSF